MTELLLGIDLGTGSSKGVLATPGGRLLATATREHAMELPRPGWAEVDADAVWWAEVVSLARELTAVAGVAGGTVAGVCVSGVGPCLLLTDADTRPRRPAILYGIDARAGAEIEELTERYGEAAIVARGGSALSTQAVGPKLLWVARHEPEVWARSRRWFGPSSFAVARLTGEYVLDHHTASQCDPLYDLGAHEWHRPWADELAGHLAMPRLVWPGAAVGTVTAAAAAETGLPAGIPVAAGTVDAWAEAFSAGVRAPGDLMLMYGSTMFFVQMLAERRSHPLLWTTTGVEPGTHSLAAGMSTSGSLTRWVRDLTGGATFAELATEAAAVPPGSDGLVLLPYFAGERAPVFDDRARGVVAGLTLRHTRGHLFRAVYEGIACGIAQILELLDESGGPARRIVAVGGGTLSPLWTQIVSDVTGREQLLPAQTIGASYGDALLAGIAAGVVPPDTDWARPGTVVTPDPDRRAVYAGLLAAYTDLYPATRRIVHALQNG